MKQAFSEADRNRDSCLRIFILLFEFTTCVFLFSVPTVRREQNRFVVDIEGSVAVLEYENISNGGAADIHFKSTKVPESLGGKGE